MSTYLVLLMATMVLSIWVGTTFLELMAVRCG
jgi:hypothetical protein